MARWLNQSLRVYHGTDSRAFRSSNTIDLQLCRPLTDFGKGFYLTTSLHQAKEWANTRVRRMGQIHGAHAVVLKAVIDRDQLAALDTLVFVRPTEDFWDLVSDCRQGIPPHQRQGAAEMFDVVFGLVTLWPQRLIIDDCDQISFHTNRAAGLLNLQIHLEANATDANQRFF